MRLGLLYQPHIAASVRHAERVRQRLADLGVDAWSASSFDIVDHPHPIEGSQLLLTFGGDGTVLRAARTAAPFGVPCAGVNYGRIGFLTEFSGAELDACLPDLVAGRFWIEPRLLIDWTRVGNGSLRDRGIAAGDVVVGRGRIARVIQVEVRIDDAELATYTADGVIVAAPTGTTGYTQAAGGPVLHPEVRELVVTPIAPFLTPANSIVVGPDVTIDICARTTHEATLSIDGQTDYLLDSGDRVVCRASEHVAQFARVQSRAYFYATLAEKLRWRGPHQLPRPSNSET